MDLLIISTLVKFLLFPAYHSTDFDVHRNWLAITKSLPLSEWYFEDTSEWTLDYPPLFAYLEYFIGKFAPVSVIEDKIFELRAADGQHGWPTIKFQRLSVMATELVYYLSLRAVEDPLIANLLWMSPQWLILDHIHFQYNTVMCGIFVYSLVCMVNRQYLRSALLFSTLICFKHLYLYVVPAFFVYLLVNYALTSFASLVKLALVTLTPPAIAFLPFINQMPQLLSRLFPFARGLTHSYWAPNFWALYSVADRVLGIYFKNSVESATRGVVGQIAFSNLIEILPKHTFVITLAMQILGCIRREFLESVCLCAFASFTFGYHVHEKAVMTVLVPFILICRRSQWHLNAFLPLLTSSCFSLFPLIFTPNETIFKYTYTIVYLLASFVLLPTKSAKIWKLNYLYFAGYLVVMPLSAAIPFYLPKYEYAGLMLISVYSSFGVLVSYLMLLIAPLAAKKPIASELKSKSD